MISEPSRVAPRYLSDLFRNGTPAALSDAELLNRFASRQNEHDETAELAFAALLARHGPMVLRVCRAVLGDRHEVEDAFQATFLVLAVRARSIRRRGSVASWLHGVALRVAASERARAARRRRHELIRAAMTSSTTENAGGGPVCEHELTAAIHEEIGRLPEKYRAAVVLCYLEGLTHEMAAERLGWPVGSVKSRLAWARERLRVRLTRRGMASTTFPFDRSGLSRDAESAVVLLGTRLADATLRGALKAGTGNGALVGIVSAEAVALMEGVIKSLTNARLILIATAALMAGLVTAGAGEMGYSAIRQESLQRTGRTGPEARQPIAVAQVAQGPPLPPAAKPATDQGPLVIGVEVVDSEGHRLSGADVVVTLWYSRGFGNNEAVVERTRTDGAGRVQFKVARERPGSRIRSADVWAHQAGRAFATTNVLLTGNLPPSVVHLTLAHPAKWTITVLGPDDQPIAGLRLTPRLFRRTTPMALTVPDGLLEQLTVTTDVKGMATLAYMPDMIEPQSIQVAGQGVASHTLPLDVSRGKDVVLRLGRPGRVVGIVRTATGAPLADVRVELWVQGSGSLPAGLRNGRGDQRITSDEVVRLAPQPLRTGPQGAFQTPATLLSGSTYRVSIRQNGFVPFVSDWVTLKDERAAIPPIRLQPIQTLTGQIKDRQGRAIASARVFLPAGGPATVADDQGRFALAGTNPGKTVILVEQKGFRLQGWLVDPPSQTEVGVLTLVRASETAGPVMKALAEPIPSEESRALANRLLDPYLQDAPENDDERPSLAAISALGEFDLDRALDLLQSSKFHDEDVSHQNIRGGLATQLAEKSPARAQAMAESITDPLTKVGALIGVARALPASERGRKRALLEQAATVLRDRLQQANPGRRLLHLSEIAGQWLDMGERGRARHLLDQGKTSSDVFQAGFLGQLGRLEPEQAIATLQKLPNRVSASARNGLLAEVAAQLAIDHPGEAERVFNLREVTGGEDHVVFAELRLCRRMARVDPQRARRVAASLRDTGTRACAWASVAVGLAENDKAGAAAAMNSAIEEIDRLRESGPGPGAVYIINGIRLMAPTNPAAQILPVVERIAPDRLAEVFWRAVALHPRIETDREDLLPTSYIGYECTLLARYDRAVAAVLFEPMNSYLLALAVRKGPLAGSLSPAIMAKACIDPRTAVALVESLTSAGDFIQANPPHPARRRLAELLGRPPDVRWMRLWRFMGTEFDD